MGKSLLTLTAVLLALLSFYFVYEIQHESGISAPKENVKLPNDAQLNWRDCWFDAPKFVHCADFHTAPEQAGQASSFILPVVVFRNSGFTHKPDPVMYMAGGPGSSAGLDKKQMEGYWFGWFNNAKLNRDLVLFDQRGTGLSQPKLRCNKFKQAMRETMSRKMGAEEKARIIKTAIDSCIKYMRDQGMPLNEISTLHSAADVSNIMDALDYSSWNLYGVSYSTRLAMVIERKSPGKVRTLLLDSVYPVQKHFMKEWPGLLKASMDRIFDYCDNQLACKQQYGNVETVFWETMQKLSETPLIIPVENPQPGFKEVVFDDYMLIDFLFDIQYESGMLYDLPAVIKAFNEGNVAALKSFVSDFLDSRLQSSVSEVVFRTIECRDNPSPSAEEIEAIYNQYPKFKPYLMMEYDDCRQFGIDESKHTKISTLMGPSSTPVMILAGEDDPVTPVSWVQDVLELYPDVQMYNFPHTSHAVMEKKDCAIELYKQFLDNPRVRPTADCRE